MVNKKIKNATEFEYDGIEFKSKLEVMVYKTLIENGITPFYEKLHYVLWEGFIPKVPFYTKNHFKRKDYRIEVLSSKTVRDNRPLDSITYTPDFTFEYGNKFIIVEAKGMQNDVFPYKFKMFRKYLEELNNNSPYTYEVWEVFTKTQLLECINHLKKSV